MPEGDTIHQTAERLGAALGGAIAQRVAGSHREVGRLGARLAGRRILGVTSIGKHVVVRFDGDWSLRTHLGMPGAWHLYRPGERWRTQPGAARVIIETSEWHAVCFAAPTVQIGPDRLIDERLAHLGPDLIGAAPDIDEVVARARSLDQTAPACDLLLDQRVMAGVGNVFKSEVLFMEGIHPLTPIARLTDEQIAATARRPTASSGAIEIQGGG